MRRETLVQPQHLERLALVYVRQSTPGQVLTNRESTRLQYGLRERAEQLGWTRDGIQTIDEDLGVSGAGEQRRRGFSRLVLEVARGKVGAVFGLDASRFSRNEPEWFELLRWLRATGTLLVTDEGVYDARNGDDSFVLGLHGTLSAAELYKIRARMDKGKLSKAMRGELYVAAPTGYVVDGKELRKDPDEHVREAIGLVFAKFRELGTARQVARALRAAGVRLPSRHTDERGLEWREATYSRVWNVLRHPAMGGAYAWGRTRTRVRLDERDQARKSTRKVPMEDWKVLLTEHHEGYVEWEEWLAIQQRLAANSVAQGGSGAPREGRALLQGLALCGHCGRHLQVRYASAVQYRCARGQDGEGGCQQLGGERLDRLAAEALLEAVGPAGVEAALRAERLQEEEGEQQLLGYRREVERKEWEERKADSEYFEIEAKFRRVKKTLADRWERAQEQLEQAREELEQARQRLPARSRRPPDGAFEGLAGRLRAVWEHAATSWRDRKRLLATVLEEVVLTADREARKLHVLLRWRGGWIDERELPLRPPPPGVRTEASTLALIRRLAQLHADPELAGELKPERVEDGARAGLHGTAGRELAGPARHPRLRQEEGCRSGDSGGSRWQRGSWACRWRRCTAGSIRAWFRPSAGRAGIAPGCRVRLDESVGGEVWRDGPGGLRAGCGRAAGTGRVAPDAVVAHPGRRAAGAARGTRAGPGPVRPAGRVGAAALAGIGRRGRRLMPGSECVGLAGNGPGHGPGPAWGATHGLRDALPRAHAHPDAFSLRKTPLRAAVGATRRANVTMTMRTVSVCGVWRGLFSRFDPAMRQEPTATTASRQAPRTQSRGCAAPRPASHDVNADARRVPMRSRIRRSLYISISCEHQRRPMPCLHNGDAL